MSDEAAATPVETAASLGTAPGDDYQRWYTEIDLGEKELKTWRERVRKVLQRYIDDRGDSPEAGRNSRTAKFNILWSVVQTNSPAYYLKTPKCTVDRRYKDSDPLSRAASQILERVTQTQLTLDQNFHNAMRGAVLDFQLAARGCAWVRYVPQFDPNDENKVAWETAPVDYIHWEDFCHNPARTWAEVRWVSRKHYFTRTQCVSLFGGEIGNAIQLDYNPRAVASKQDAPNRPEHEFYKKASTYEIWDKESRKRIWLVKGYVQRPAKEEPDPLQLDRFFPCPRPLYGTVTNDSLVPVPDYTLWQDQADEIDRLTTRIDRIARAIKVAGAYDTAFPELARILQDTFDGDLVPVQNWIKFAEGGGFKGSTDYLQIDQYVKALQVLVEARGQAKNDLYEITGQADIIRGSSNPNETATAQRIKGQFATLRLQDRQGEVQRFARDTVELVAEIVATKFQPETLAMQAGIDTASDPEVAQVFPQAVQMLRDDARRTFRVDIETDSMIALDQQADKQDATELVTAIGTYLEKAMPLAQTQPAIGPLLGQILLFAVRRFRAGRDLESTIEQGLRQLEQVAKQPQQPPPDPKMLKAQASVQADQQKQQGEQAMQGQQQQFDQRLAEHDQQHKQALAEQEMRIKAMLEAHKASMQQNGEVQQAQDSGAQMGEALAMLAQAVEAMTAMASQHQGMNGQMPMGNA